MRAISKIADRLLSAVVPKITAGACCPKDTTRQFCYYHPAGSGIPWYRYCSYNCACQLVCGACGF